MGEVNTFLSKDEHIEMKTLQKELAYYTNLLSNYSSSKPKNNRNIAPQNYTRLQKFSKNMPYKRPDHNALKIVKNHPARGITSYSTNSSSSMLNAKPFTQGNKNTLFNNKNISSKVWVMPSNNSLQKANNNTLPTKINSFKRTFHLSNLNSSKRTVLFSSLNKNSEMLHSNLNPLMIEKQPVKSISQDLMNEIITLTKKLKQTTGNLPVCNKLKPSNSKVNIDTFKRPLLTVLSGNDSTNHKLLVTKSEVPKKLSQNTISKLENLIQMRESEFVNITTNELNLKDECGVLKINSTLSTPKDKESSAVYNSFVGDEFISDKLLCSKSKNGKEPIISSDKEEEQYIKKQFVGSSSKCPVKMKTFRISTPKTLSSAIPMSSSQLMKKYSIDAKKRLDNRKKLIASKYKVVNDRTSQVNKLKPENLLQKKHVEDLSSLQINCRKKLSSKFESVKNTPTKSLSAKRCRKKLNLKYKVINKAMTPVNVSLKNASLKSCKRSRQRSHIKRMQSVYKIVNDNISNVEQKLSNLSESTVFNDRKVNQSLTSTSKVFSSLAKASPKIHRLNSVKTLCKKTHNLDSKYKVVNKSSVRKPFIPSQHVIKSRIISPRKLIYIRKSLPGNRTTKSKFVSVKKNFSAVNNLPSYQSHEKCMLLKRIYKSKNTIINKNTNNTSLIARLIKTKYFALNRRKPISSRLSMSHVSSGRKPQVHSYPRRSNFKGQSMTLTHRRCSYFRSTNGIFKGNFRKRKPRVGTCVRRKTASNARSSVLIIRGERFAASSSGKKLKKLSNSVQRKNLSKRIAFHGKSLKTSPKVLKTSTPVTKTLASRVLHRSINRVLTASVKKKLTKVNRYCMFYNRFGRCNKGVKCSYIHDPSKIAVCTRFLRGTCKIDGCSFSHEISPGKMAICSFFLLGSCNKTDCPYRHEILSPSSELCKAFVQGYCANGKECKKAHILVCPQYIQGVCEKGDACAFPHPPQKAKKNLQQDISSDKNVKDSEELVEKVTRYFQPFIEVLSSVNQGASESINVVISRSRTLPEQPSFIPLYDTPVSTRSSCLPKKLECPQQPSCVPSSLDFDEMT